MFVLNQIVPINEDLSQDEKLDQVVELYHIFREFFLAPIKNPDRYKVWLNQEGEKSDVSYDDMVDEKEEIRQVLGGIAYIFASQKPKAVNHIEKLYKEARISRKYSPPEIFFGTLAATPPQRKFPAPTALNYYNQVIKDQLKEVIGNYEKIVAAKLLTRDELDELLTNRNYRKGTYDFDQAKKEYMNYNQNQLMMLLGKEVTLPEEDRSKLQKITANTIPRVISISEYIYLNGPVFYKAIELWYKSEGLSDLFINRRHAYLLIVTNLHHLTAEMFQALEYLDDTVDPDLYRKQTDQILNSKGQSKSKKMLKEETSDSDTSETSEPEENLSSEDDPDSEEDEIPTHKIPDEKLSEIDAELAAMGVKEKQPVTPIPKSSEQSDKVLQPKQPTILHSYINGMTVYLIQNTINELPVSSPDKKRLIDFKANLEGLNSTNCTYDLDIMNAFKDIISKVNNSSAIKMLINNLKDIIILPDYVRTDFQAGLIKRLIKQEDDLPDGITKLLPDILVALLNLDLEDKDSMVSAQTKIADLIKAAESSINTHSSSNNHQILITLYAFLKEARFCRGELLVNMPKEQNQPRNQ